MALQLAHNVSIRRQTSHSWEGGPRGACGRGLQGRCNVTEGRNLHGGGMSERWGGAGVLVQGLIFLLLLPKRDVRLFSG